MRSSKPPDPDHARTLALPRLSCFDSKPGCHPGGPSLTLGRRTTTCSSGSTARCKRATVRIVTAARLYASAEDSKRSSKAHWVGSIPTGSTLPRSTSGEVIGFSSRIDGLDTHTRCPCLCRRIGGFATNEADEGSTPSRDSRLSPRDLAATFRPSHDAVRLCAGALASMEQWWLTTLIR